MIEFVIKGKELGNLHALGIALGLSITFRRVLVLGEFRDEWIDIVRRSGIWGAMLLSPCPQGLPCVRDLEEAIALSEKTQSPIGYEGEEPLPRPFRVSTFNKNYLRARRWVHTGSAGREYLPLFACLYNLLKLRDDVPIVVSDIYMKSPVEEKTDYQVLPTYFMPDAVSEIVSVHLPPIPAVAIAKGILIGGYKAGPVIAISTGGTDDGFIELGGYIVDINRRGDPCRLFRERVVGYDYKLFEGKFEVEPSLCDRCGDCFLSSCDALAMDKGGAPKLLESCTGCGACALLCTRRAIRRVNDTFKLYIR